MSDIVLVLPQKRLYVMTMDKYEARLMLMRQKLNALSAPSGSSNYTDIQMLTIPAEDTCDSILLSTLHISTH